jgi:hypothetical protein
MLTVVEQAPRPPKLLDVCAESAVAGLMVNLRPPAPTPILSGREYRSSQGRELLATSLPLKTGWHSPLSVTNSGEKTTGTGRCALRWFLTSK